MESVEGSDEGRWGLGENGSGAEKEEGGERVRSDEREKCEVLLLVIVFPSIDSPPAHGRTR